MTNRESFPPSVSRAGKKVRGRTAAATTPLTLHARIPLEDAERQGIHDRVARKLAKWALHIERVALRLDDVNGPRGGEGVVCKIQIVRDGLPPIVVEERGADAAALATRTVAVAERALRRDLDRRGRAAAREPRGASRAAVRPRKPEAAPQEDSLIDRRVGHARANLERALARPEKTRRDVYVDTAAPGTSASDRRVGYGHTARRNTRRERESLTSALEDSRTTPSRKSTRKSHGRSRPSAPLERTESLKSVTPKARAARAQAARKGKGRR